MVRPALQLKPSLRLRMTPQMQQAIRLLQVPILDLKAQIDEALNENVFLESEEAETHEKEDEGPQGHDDYEIPTQDKDGEEETDSFGAFVSDDIFNDESQNGNSSSPSDGVDRTTYNETLSNHLYRQLLELENLGERKRKIGYAIIDSIDENGYLTADLSAIQDTVAPEVIVSIDEIEAILERVQQLSPIGVGARTPEECLLLQLKQLDSGIPGLELARSIVEKEKLYELFVSQNFDQLKQEFGSSDEDLQGAIALVRTCCQAHPCGSISTPTVQIMIPDVFVHQVDNRWVVEVNDSPIPQLKINQIYANALGNKGRYAECRAQLVQAEWLIQSLEKRRETLEKVARAIVRQQKEFFEKGPEYMRPMVHRDIAQDIEMNESTVSRIAATKWMQTPRGPLEFSFFFSSGLDSNAGKKSSTAVRAIIQKFINDENKSRPLSDRKISVLLSDKGINVAPRTVTKYRKKDGIPSSIKRKEG